MFRVSQVSFPSSDSVTWQSTNEHKCIHLCQGLIGKGLVYHVIHPYESWGCCGRIAPLYYEKVTGKSWFCWLGGQRYLKGACCSWNERVQLIFRPRCSELHLAARAHVEGEDNVSLTWFCLVHADYTSKLLTEGLLLCSHYQQYMPHFYVRKIWVD